MLSRIFVNYVENTTEGKKTVLKILKTEAKPVDRGNTYWVKGKEHFASGKVKPTDLTEFHGLIYQNRICLDPKSIEVEKNGNLEHCETTGILGPKDYCVITVKETKAGGGEALVSMSNYARLHSQDMKIRDTASRSVCMECTSIMCDYHPIREPKQTQMLLRPPEAYRRPEHANMLM